MSSWTGSGASLSLYLFNDYFYPFGHDSSECLLLPNRSNLSLTLHNAKDLSPVKPSRFKVIIVAIVCITAIEIAAIIAGFNGLAFTTAVGAVASLAGWTTAKLPISK